MHNMLSLLLLMLVLSAPSADELIDDFERGGSRNLRNGDWFYFSDVNDGGNSEIINSEMLSLGSYSALKPVKEGSDSGYCAKLEYILGDIRPEVKEGGHTTEHCNFTGIGTDIARAGGVTDIRPAYGISFKARSRDSIIIYFELVTGNIYDYGYYRAYFWVTDTWKTFKVDFNDTNQFMFPDNWVAYDIEDHPLMLSKVQKMNWQVAACFDNIGNDRTEEVYGYCHCHSISGYLYLDDIVLLDSSAVRIDYEKMKIKPANTVNFPDDLLGRKISNPAFFNRASGVYVMPGEKKLLWAKRMYK